MCPWVGPHAPSFGRQLWGPPSCVEYLLSQGVLLPLVYGTTASPLWLELRGHSAWQATPSWTVYRLAYHRLLPWLRETFAMVPDAAWLGSDQWPWSTVRLTHGVLVLSCPSAALRVCTVLGRLAPVHRCARAFCCVACAVSWATWLPFTGAPAGCVVLRVRYPGPLGSCSPVHPLGGLLCVCGVLGHLAPVPVCPLGVVCCEWGVLGHLAPIQRCARSVCCFACAVSWATRLLFTGVLARFVVLLLRCPGPLGSCSSVRLLRVLLCVCGVLGHLASCSRVCPLRGLCCVCGVPGHLASVHRCARSVCCVVHAVTWATWLLFSGVPAWCVVLCVWCPGPLGSRSPVRPLGVLLRVCGVLGPLAPVHRCAHSVCCFACAVSWASWLLFTGVPAQCVVWRVPCRGPLGSCSPVRPLGVLLCVCGVLGHLAPVHRCARSVCCFACAVFWATWLLFNGVPARCVVLCVRCPGPLGSCSPVRSLGVLLRVCGVLGPLALVHRCAHSVCFFACAVSWA